MGTAWAMTDRTAHVDTILFDIDGTLLDSNYHHTLAWHRAFRSHGHDIPCALIHRHIGMGGDRLVAAVAGDDVEQQDGDAVRDSWEKEYDALLEEPMPLPGAKELLNELRSRGLRVVLASSSIPKHAGRAMEVLDAGRRVDAATTSEDASESKPDPELLRTAIERVEGRESLLVGDSVWDVEAAHRAGIPAVAVETGGVSAQELRHAGATWVFADVRELIDHLDQVIA